MRTIKFRAWDKNNLRMLEHEQLLKSSPYYQSPFTRDDIELMQFTGLLDKNGREIYEGDIIKHPVCELGRVIFFQPYAGFFVEARGLLYNLNTSGDYEVIGNQFENPELLS
jgi:hypothetical protein